MRILFRLAKEPPYQQPITGNRYRAVEWDFVPRIGDGVFVNDGGELAEVVGCRFMADGEDAEECDVEVVLHVNIPAKNAERFFAELDVNGWTPDSAAAVARVNP